MAADGPQYPRRGPSGPGRSRGAAVRMKFEELTIEQIEAHKAWRRMGLTDDEHRRIAELLGRPPNWTELGMFSVLWSEHCAYKHSRALFPLFPTDGPQILQGPGENAGVVDIGDGWAVVFKIESHNHPSAIDPYQGAATGVGGILRDIFAMGARPVAVLNSLRLGPLEDERARELLKGIVSGIAGYGNVAGVPTVGGEIGFDASFQGNPLVNAMAVGIVRHEMVMRASAEGVGNPVMAVGARTGRDGIHGASFASAELSEGSDEGLPQVQVGDPHIGKRLIEACLELYETGLVVGVQDMGAAGLTSSSCEMASRAGSGIELNLDAVPLREEGMTPYEIMLSESQERMLVVPKRGAEERVQEIFRKWGLEAAVVGRVTDDGMLRVYSRGQCVAEAPAKALSTDGAPMYHPEAKEPERLKELWQTPLPDGPVADPGDRLRELLASPNIAQKAWVYEQFDYKAGGAAVLAPGRADAAVIRVGGGPRGLALTTDCNSLYCYLDPYEGARHAVAEAARNLVCVGAKPLAVTDGMNFGSPENPEIFWQFKRAVEGIRDACLALGTPVTGGNVSFYNETEAGPVHPTPIIGMIGVLEDADRSVGMGFPDRSAILLIGPFEAELGGSEHLRLQGIVAGRPPRLDLRMEAAVQELVRSLIGEGLVEAAHDCSEGGLLAALAESCLSGGVGAEVRLPIDEPLASALFGEAPSRILCAVSPDRVDAIRRRAEAAGAPCLLLGETGGSRLKVNLRDGRTCMDESLEDLSAAWRGAFERLMQTDR